MDAQVADLIKESSPTTGTTATLSLAAITGFARFSDVFPVDTLVEYATRDGNNFEQGIGTVKAGNTLERTTPYVTYESGVYDNSSPSRINLSGSAVVACVVSARLLVDIANDGASVDSVNAWLKGQSGTPLSVAFSSSISLDLSLRNNFTIGAITSNFTLANPTNIVAGQSGYITLPKDGTGGWTIALGTYFKTPGGAGITLSTAAGVVDTLEYRVRSATEIDVVLNKDWS